MTLAERLTELRKANNWTQLDLAKKAKLDPSYISHLEAGRRMPKLGALSKLAKAFKLPVSELMESVK